MPIERKDIQEVYETADVQRQDYQGHDAIVLLDKDGNLIAWVDIDDVFDADGNRFEH